MEPMEFEPMENSTVKTATAAPYGAVTYHAVSRSAGSGVKEPLGSLTKHSHVGSTTLLILLSAFS